MLSCHCVSTINRQFQSLQKTGVLTAAMLAVTSLACSLSRRFANKSVSRYAFAAPTILEAVKANPQDWFVLVLRGLLESLFIERMDQNVEIFARYMNEPGFRRVVDGRLSDQVYRRLADGPAGQPPAAE